MVQAMNHRIKGETSLPVNTLALLGKIGVTRAAKEIGTSTTTLHKARKNNVVSKVVETAAASVLEHLSDKPRRVAAPPSPKGHIHPEANADRATRVYLLEVDAEAGPLVEQLAKALKAELVSA